MQDVTERKSVEQQLLASQAKQAFLLKLSDTIAPIENASQIQAEAMRVLGQHLAVNRAEYFEIDCTGQFADALGGYADGLPPLRGRFRLSDFGRGPKEAFDAGLTFVVSDTADLPISDGDRNTYDATGTRSAVAVPISKAGKLRAVLAVSHHRPRDWSPEDVTAIEETAERTWDAVERARAEAALRASEQRLRAFTNATNDVVYRMSRNWSEMRELDGLDFIAETPEPNRAWLSKYIPPDDQAQVMQAIESAIATKGAFELEHRVIRPDGSLGWTHSRAIPILDEADAVIEWFGTASDVTHRRQTEERLRAAHDTLRHLVERSPFGVYVVDADFRLVQVSDGAQKVFEKVRPLLGRDFAEVLRSIWPEPFASEAIGIFRHALATGEPYHSPSTVERRADIDATEAYDWKVERIVLPDGRPGVVCHFYDLSERQRHEEHIQLLMREVSHRANNMLSLVQAIARQTAATSPDDFVKKFTERVRALAASQDLVVRSGWKAVAIVDLVRTQLSHFADLIGERILLTGPPVSVTPAAAQALGMALHELATNAAKYGSLSIEPGRVGVTWNVGLGGAEPLFTLSWAEIDGPQVEAPHRHGFGSTVTSSMVKMSLGGEVSVDYAASGLVWRLDCPAERIVEGLPISASRRVPTSVRAS